MANRSSNIERNLWTIEKLKINPGDAILEIGCGPGIALSEASKFIDEGQIIGLDHSQTMIKQAAVRVRKHNRGNKIQLVLGTLNNISERNQLFDKIFSVNVVQFWDNQETEFKRMFSCLKKHGIAVTTYMPRARNSTRKDALEMADMVAMHMKNAGFLEIKISELATKHVPTVCITGQRR